MFLSHTGSFLIFLWLIFIFDNLAHLCHEFHSCIIMFSLFHKFIKQSSSFGCSFFISWREGTPSIRLCAQTVLGRFRSMDFVTFYWKYTRNHQQNSSNRDLKISIWKPYNSASSTRLTQGVNLIYNFHIYPNFILLPKDIFLAGAGRPLLPDSLNLVLPLSKPE